MSKPVRKQVVTYHRTGKFASKKYCMIIFSSGTIAVLA